MYFVTCGTAVPLINKELLINDSSYGEQLPYDRGDAKRIPGAAHQKNLSPPQLAIDIDLVRTNHFSKEELPPIVLSTLAFTHDHLFDRQLTISHLKEVCDINGNNLSGEFKYYIGKTPKKYINIYRVEASTNVLRDDRLKDVVISHIASAVGYRRSSTFTKAFKNIMGMPPSKWRAS